jgi:hypothetical protein
MANDKVAFDTKWTENIGLRMRKLQRMPGKTGYGIAQNSDCVPRRAAALYADFRTAYSRLLRFTNAGAAHRIAPHFWRVPR